MGTLLVGLLGVMGLTMLEAQLQFLLLNLIFVSPSYIVPYIINNLVLFLCYILISFFGFSIISIRK